MNQDRLEDIKRVPLPRILADHGILPARQRIVGKTSYLYRAPGRADDHPSLSVFLSGRGQWLFHDFATGEVGTNLDAMVRFGIVGNWKEAAKYIEEHYIGVSRNEFINMDNVQLSHTGTPKKAHGENGTILSLLPLAGNALKYVKGRGIPSAIATKYLQWAKYTFDGQKTFSGIAWPTYSGGYGIRWAADLENGKGKSFVGPAGFSFFPVASTPTETCMVFEGIFDFLSVMVLDVDGNRTDALVLNSVENLPNALPLIKKYPRVLSFFDNDPAGQNATEILSTSRPGVTSLSHTFSPYNDLNDYLKSISDETGLHKGL